MNAPSPREVTRLLLDWSGGDREAFDKLMPAVFDELRRVAAGHLRRERPDHTLQATALVNEAYLRLAGEERVSWECRAHFFGAASRLMRRILVDHARERQAEKRGGGYVKVSLTLAEAEPGARDLELLALDAALDELARLDPRQSRVVELRYFGGLSIEETAEVVGVSPATVKRHWGSARAWLYRRIAKTDE